MNLKQVYLTAAEPEGLARFYEGLGLTIRFADPGKWVQFAGEKTSFCVAGPTESVSTHSRDAVLVFEVSDLEAAIGRARAMGAEVSDKISRHGRARASCARAGSARQHHSALSERKQCGRESCLFKLICQIRSK